MISLHLSKQNGYNFPFVFFDDKAEWKSYLVEHPTLWNLAEESPDARYKGGSTIEVFANAVEYIPRSLFARPYQYWIAHRIINLLNEENKGKVLDYGAGAGSMGMVFAHAGFQTDFLEVEGVMTDFLKWRVKKHFLKSRVFTHKQQLEENYYDFVSLLNVVEHLDDPLESVKQIISSMSVGGYLLLICNTSGKGLDVVSPDVLENVVKSYIRSKCNLIPDTDDMLYQKI